MPNRIEVDPVFARAYKKLAKKYASFPDDLRLLVEELKENALLGVSLGGNVRKVRLAIRSKGKGKSGPRSRPETTTRLRLASEGFLRRSHFLDEQASSSPRQDSHQSVSS